MTDEMRQFQSGATRQDDSQKIDYEGFLSPYALQAYAIYMHQHRIQADGRLRASDNWQNGIPVDAYAKSLIRHVMDFWLLLRSGTATIERPDGEEVTYGDSLCAILFNAMGLLHELEKPRG